MGDTYLKDKFPEPNQTIEIEDVSFQHQQIFSVVKDFYTEVAKDDLLAQAFSHVKDWDFHFEIMTHFWWSRMGGGVYIFYPYNPVKKHFENGFSSELLSRWLSLFKIALEKNLNMEQVSVWLLIAETIGRNLLVKNNHVTQMMSRNGKS